MTVCIESCGTGSTGDISSSIGTRREQTPDPVQTCQVIRAQKPDQDMPDSIECQGFDNR